MNDRLKRDHQCETPDAKCSFVGIVYWREECLLWLCPPHFLVPCQGHCVMSPHPRTYQELVAEYKRLRAAEGSGIGMPGDAEKAYYAAQVAVQKALKDAQDAWFEVNLVKLHLCQNCWDDADVCKVCGADGRQ